MINLKKIFNGRTSRKMFFLYLFGSLGLVLTINPEFFDISRNFFTWVTFSMVMMKRRLNDVNVDITQPQFHNKFKMIYLLSKKTYPYENKFGNPPRF